MKPAAFRYYRARDVDDATALLAELGDDAKVIAGGQSLVAMMNFRLARPAHLVDIAGLRELAYLSLDANGAETNGGGALRIGALTTHHAVEISSPQQLGAGSTSYGTPWRGSATCRSAPAARSAAASRTATRPPSGACSPCCWTPSWWPAARAACAVSRPGVLLRLLHHRP